LLQFGLVGFPRRCILCVCAEYIRKQIEKKNTLMQSSVRCTSICTLLESSLHYLLRQEQDGHSQCAVDVQFKFVIRHCYKKITMQVTKIFSGTKYTVQDLINSGTVPYTASYIRG
jgi:hypothetical protein